ncbi:MAG: rhomboid family intramembrane serine protease, partial [Flavobacteriales bacterium]
AVLFLYGSIIWGIFPIEERVSWEGHLGGALAGVLLAFVYRKELPERPKTRWEIEEELELLKSERDASNPVKPNGKTSIVQIYRQLRHRGIDRGF